MNDLQTDYLAKDTFAKALGVELLEVDQGFARCKLKLAESHKNGLGTVHGGVLFSLADIAYAVACNTEKTSTGLQADIKFFKKAEGEYLIAEAKLISASSKIGNYEVKIYDGTESLIALFSAVSYRFASS